MVHERRKNSFLLSISDFAKDMAGKGRGRGRGRGRGKASSSQPSIQSSLAPLSTPSLLPQSSHSHIELRPTPSHTKPTLIHLSNPQTVTPSAFSSHSQTVPTHTPSPHLIGTSTNMLGDPSPNSSAEPHDEVASVAPEEITWGKKDVDGRVWIKPAPGNNFYPEHKTKGKITKIFKNKFEGAWSSWSDVDDDTINMWFEEFKSMFKWLEKDEDHIKKCFHSRGSEALSKAMYKVWSGEDKGYWINPNMLEQLKLEWKNEDGVEKSSKSQQNRQSVDEHNVPSGKEHATGTMAGRGKGRGRGRGKVASQPSVPPQSSHSPIEPTPRSPPRTRTSTSTSTRPSPINLPLPHSQTVPTTSLSSHSQTEPAHIPSPHLQIGASSELASLRLLDIPWGEADEDGRVWIKPAAGNNFYPEDKTRGKITKIFKKKFEGPWLSWGNVDEETMNMWFEDFKAMFKWLEGDEDRIKKCFHSRGTEALSNAMYRVRSGQDKGNWINPNILEQLRLEWNNEDWLEKSRKNKQNRHSKVELNVHGGGSISAREHAKRMKIENNKEPTCFELYERLHRPKGKPDQWFNETQGKIAETYQTQIAEKQSQGGEGTSQQNDDDNVFLNVVGSISKKGRIYGIGSLGADVKASSSSPGGVTSEEVVAMKGMIHALAAEVKQKNLEQQMMVSKMEEWEKMFRSLMPNKKVRTSPRALTGQDKNYDENLGEDDMDEDDNQDE